MWVINCPLDHFLSSKITTEEYRKKKWGIVFDYLDQKRRGILQYDEIMAYPKRLRDAGKTDKGERLSQCCQELWRRLCDCLELPRSSDRVDRAQWITGIDRLRETGWFTPSPSRWLRSISIPLILTKMGRSPWKNGGSIRKTEATTTRRQ